MAGITGHLRIAFIIRTLSTGGAEMQLVRMLRWMDRSRFAPSVFLLIRDANHRLKPEVERSGVSVFVSPYKKNDPRQLFWLKAHFRRLGIQVAHSFLWRSDLVVSLVKWMSWSFKLVISERGERIANYTLLYRLIDRCCIFPLSDRLCANSQCGAGVAVRNGFPEEKVGVIRNGIDLEEIDGRLGEAIPSDSCPVVGMVARLDPYKAHSDFIHAAALLNEVYAGQVRFLIVGDGPLLPVLQDQVHDLDLEATVKFVGYHKNPCDLVKRFDIGVLCTGRTESCPNAVLEYMACEKPVIVTDVGGVREIVEHGRTGLLVPREAPAALSEAISRLLKDPDRARAMGMSGREKIETEFSIQKVVEDYMDLYCELSGKAGSINR